MEVAALSQEELSAEVASKETQKSAMRQGLGISKQDALRAKDSMWAFKVLD